jgi:ribosomal protein S8
MVARINTSKSISKALNYNEQKLKKGTAEMLYASGFIKSTAKLNFFDKTRQFERFISLNEKTTTNTLHVSLNFDPKDSISKENLIAISVKYMEAIGFGNQPYLVYHHTDSGHPHIHIVSTNIQKDGSRISMHNLGRNQSEKVRKEIEIKYQLTKAERPSQKESINIHRLDAQKLIYGKQPLKQAISNVLREVLSNYKFSSLPELNAILGLYNVNAYRGEKDSRIYKTGGLTYRVLNAEGIPVGPLLKASSFYGKPTLSFLEKKFIENLPLKTPHSKRIKVAIEFAFAKMKQASLRLFVQELERDQISTILRKNKDELVYGITYVDHKNKTVFNGSDLGKEYSGKGILERCQVNSGLRLKTKTFSPLNSIQHGSSEPITEKADQNILDILLQSEYTSETVPYPLKKDGKKKKRKRISL